MRLPLALELYFAEIVLEALDLKPQLVVLSLEHSSQIPFFLHVLGIFDKQFILVNLELVPLLPELDCLLLGLTEPPLDVVDVSAELPALVSVFGGVLDAELQGVVVRDELLQLLVVPPAHVGDDLLVLDLA